jgi:WD40 repeat protein
MTAYRAEGGDSTRARVWLFDVESGKAIAETPGLEPVIASIAFHRDGKTLVIAAGNGPVKLWDVAGGRLQDSPEDSPTRFAGPLHSLAFSPDGKMLAAGHGSDVFTLWEAATGKEAAVLQHRDAVLGQRDTGRVLAFTPDSKSLVTRGTLQPVKLKPVERAEVSWATLWDVAAAREKAVLTGQLEHRFGTPRTFVVSPDGKTLFSGSTTPVPNEKGYVLNESPIDHVIWSLDLTGSGGTGKRLVVGPRYPRTLPPTALDPYVPLAVSPDGKTLAFQGADKVVTLWDVGAGKELATLSGHGDTVRTVAFNPDGKVLASAGKDRTVRLWDPAASKQLTVLEGHEKAVNAVVFSPDGKTLASASDDGTVRLWDVGTGKEVAVIQGHVAPVHCLTYNADGKALASGGRDSTIRVWDVSFRVR